MITTIVAITSGAGGALLSRLLPSRDKKLDDSALIRRELLDLSTELRKEMRDLEKELDEWRDRYYKLLSEHNELLGRYNLQKLQQEENEREIQGLKRKIMMLKKDMDQMKEKA